jgi:hypothetical protein
MPYKINEEEIKSVISLPANDRFAHFVSRSADWEEVWSLKNKDGWVMVSSQEGTCFPVWPHPKYAEMWATDEWSDCTAELIDMNSWLSKWIPGLTKDKIKVAVFPNRVEQGVVVSPEFMLEALKKEQEKYGET